MPSSELLRRVALIRTDVSQEVSVSIIRVTRIGELGTTLAVTSIRLSCEEISLKTAFVKATAVKTSNLTADAGKVSEGVITHGRVGSADRNILHAGEPINRLHGNSVGSLKHKFTWPLQFYLHLHISQDCSPVFVLFPSQPKTNTFCSCPRHGNP
jgi:hypothetical protein